MSQSCESKLFEVKYDEENHLLTYMGLNMKMFKPGDDVLTTGGSSFWRGEPTFWRIYGPGDMPKRYHDCDHYRVKEVYDQKVVLSPVCLRL